MRGHQWTGDNVALLWKLWAAGATATAIGLRLGGVSRSAVLGKVFRLRLNGEAGLAGPAGGTGRAPGERQAPGRRRKRQPRQFVKAPPVKRPGRFTLFDLNNESCRWPSGRRGKFWFCGVAEADVLNGIPYCVHHMRRAYTDAVRFEKPRRGKLAGGVKTPGVGGRA